MCVFIVQCGPEKKERYSHVQYPAPDGKKETQHQGVSPPPEANQKRVKKILEHNSKRKENVFYAHKD